MCCLMDRQALTLKTMNKVGGRQGSGEEYKRNGATSVNV